jgi:hypothetical protein
MLQISSFTITLKSKHMYNILTQQGLSNFYMKDSGHTNAV